MDGSRRVVGLVRDHWFVLVCMAVAAFVAVAVRAHAFPHYSGNHDEPVYVLQGRTLAAGHLTLPGYEHLRAFQPWLTGVVDGRVIFEFSPGWPAFLAVVWTLTGSMVPALPIVAALVVLGMYLLAVEASGSRAVGRVAAAVMVLTPMVVIQSGMLVSYLFTLALGSLAGCALLRGARTGARGPLVTGGLLLGVIALTRPLDALLWGIPFGLAVLAWTRGPGRPTAVRLGEGLRGVGWVAVGFVPPALVVGACNLAVTGRVTQFPIDAADPRNSFGFGDRRIMRGTDLVAYSGHDALRALGDNFRHAPPWVLGSWLGIACALVGVYLARRRPATYVLLGLVATFGLGYVFYWGLSLMGAGAPLTGPQYYMAMLAPVVVLGATTLVACWRWRPVVATGLGVAMVVVTAPTVVDRMDANREFASAWSDVHAALARFDAPDSLVFVPVIERQYLLSGPPFAMNTPDLSGDRVYAADVLPGFVDLVTSTHRTPYRVVSTQVDGPDGPVARTVVRRLRVTDGAQLRIAVRVANPTDAAVVTAYLDTGSGTVAQVLDRASTRGATYRVEWTVAAPAAAAVGTVTMPTGTSWVTAGVRIGSEAADPEAPGAAAVAELRWATRTTADAITLVRPARRYGLVDTAEFGRVLVPSHDAGALRASVRPVPAVTPVG